MIDHDKTCVNCKFYKFAYCTNPEVSKHWEPVNGWDTFKIFAYSARSKEDKCGLEGKFR